MEMLLAVFVVSLIIGLTGIGAGSLMLPVLTLLGVPIPVAIGTALSSAFVSKWFGLFWHIRHRTVDWRSVRQMLLGSMPVVCLLGLINVSKINGQYLKVGIGILVIIVGMLILIDFRHVIKSKCRGVINYYLTAGGGVIGMTMCLTSVGAGVLSTLVLTILKPELKGSKLVGTEVAHAVPVAGLAGLFYASNGAVDYHLLMMMLLGTIPGMLIGSKLCLKLPTAKIQKTVGMVLLIMGVKMVIP